MGLAPTKGTQPRSGLGSNELGWGRDRVRLRVRAGGVMCLFVAMVGCSPMWWTGGDGEWPTGHVRHRVE